MSWSSTAYAAEDVNIALMYSVGPESNWDRVIVEALDRVAENNSHGVSVSYDTKDSVYGDEAESVMNLLAKTGKYDIILSATAHSDQIQNLSDKYPDTMFVSLGSGNYNTGPNHYLMYGRVHEAAYLLGMLASSMSKTGVLGAVGSFPADDINDQINAYRAGAQAVNADAKVKISFIESWYDPQKAIEATFAQNAAGADIVYQLAGEVYEACRDKEILCFGMIEDTHEMAPDVVLSSSVLTWDPAMDWMLGEWVQAQKEGKFAGNEEAVWYGMADGGSDIAPYHALEDKVPEDVKAKIEAARADIISGKLEVPLVLDVPVSD
ncbi:BMP family protein [Ruegeria sp. Ofav3-42]|uniref:BMP family lipoprotein n=1 Tax=Ruegeria sp. Ofav3-42 TaxID=2917759 RepID=UPI001EF6548B|nr:BMP family protein [Ruegeria sp. Ofav3-42]MCG7522544.1 BMP family protein [Ruegeria sp. Ofav3-42]